MKCQIQNEDGERVCQNEAVWIHTYYATLSVCEEHFRKLAASNLGSITTEKKAAAVRENGKLGGRPKLRSENLHETCPQCFRNAGHAKGCTENYKG